MPEYTLPLIAIHISGHTETFESLKDATASGIRFNLRHREHRHQLVLTEHGAEILVRTGRFDENPWVLRDSHGRVVDPIDLPRPPYDYKPGTIFYYTQKVRAAELGIEIPLGNRSWISFYGRYRKNGRVHSEATANRLLAHDARELGIPITRFGRRRKVGPSPYEDGEIRQNQRSWKKHRRTQWKEVRQR